MTKKPAEPANAHSPPAPDPRTRVTGYMRKLLETAALTGAALGLGACEAGSTVCDPLPPPVVCPGEDAGTPGAQPAIAVSGHWVRPAGTLLVEVTLSLPPWLWADDFRGEPTATSAVVSSVTQSRHSLTFTLTPDPGATTVEVRVPLTCKGAAVVDRFSLDVSDPSEGAIVPLTPL
ncbi:MAG TPA: hypothetical protein VGQ83_03795 [Polyangia bacterium]|jgi:hypothetical protein